jgi:hypothetical protein
VLPLPRLHGVRPLHRDADRNSDAGIPLVVKVIAVVDVGDIDIVVVIPIVSPVFRPGVNETDPIALILEAWVSANNQEGQAVDVESVVRTKVSTEMVAGDTVAVVAATLFSSLGSDCQL